MIIDLSWIRSYHRLYCLRRVTQKRYQIFNTIQFINKTIALGYYRKHCTQPTLIRLPPVLYVLHTMLTCRENAGKTRSNNHKNSRMYFLKYYFHSSLTGRVTSKNSNMKRNIITFSDPMYLLFFLYIIVDWRLTVLQRLTRGFRKNNNSVNADKTTLQSRSNCLDEFLNICKTKPL